MISQTGVHGAADSSPGVKPVLNIHVHTQTTAAGLLSVVYVIKHVAMAVHDRVIDNIPVLNGLLAAFKRIKCVAALSARMNERQSVKRCYSSKYRKCV